jgi:hypothetical protein
MRDYWLTRELLSGLGFVYLFVFAIAVGLSLWLPKRRESKAVLTAVVLLIAVGPFWQSIARHRHLQEAQAAYQRLNAEAKSIFDERCKTAGEHTFRKVSQVDGVAWLRWRSPDLSREQFSDDDPMGKDCWMEGCIVELLADRKDIRSRRYTYVETVDPSDGRSYRYTGRWMSVKSVSQREFSDYVRRTGLGSAEGAMFFALQRVPIERIETRYGVTWKDVSSYNDRQHWIAGSSLAVVDLEAGNATLAERRAYMRDPFLGNTSGERHPWGWALSYGPKCPSHEINSWKFISQTLQPANSYSK